MATKEHPLAKVSPRQAAFMLAAILGNELSVHIDADDLHGLLNRSWDVISPLAHAVHGTSAGAGPLGGHVVEI